MLQPGRYIAEEVGDIHHAYKYILLVKETEKSYVFKMAERHNRYACDHLDVMFKGKKQVVISKKGPPRHGIRVWSEDEFTLYPFRLGTPFYFQKERDA